jgi:imidazolonepropionase-like amidohydrolase
MKTKIILLYILAVCVVPAFSQTYIKNVTIIDVMKNKLLPSQTVVITDGVISGIYSSKTKIPESAKVIDGEGKFLIPGLTDSHVHFFQSGGLYTRPDVFNVPKYRPYAEEITWVHDHMGDFLRRYTSVGITTVIDPGATLNLLKERDSLSKKDYAPAIYMAGPLLTTYEPPAFKNLKGDEPFNLITTIDDAKAQLEKQLPYHPDFIKIWYIVQGAHKDELAKKYQPMVKAIIDEAHQNHLRVAVHATERVTAQLAVESGCDYLVHEVGDEVVSTDFINLLKKNKVVLCPTLIVEGGYYKTFTQQQDFSYYEFTHANPEQLGSLQDLKHLPDTALVNFNKQRWLSSTAGIAKDDSINMANLKKMADAGVIIAAGTDAGNIGTMHASSFFSELKAMQQSGLTNWQIIQSATINGARAIGKEKEFGSIEKGKRADLVLLDANPIENLENLQKINLVINKGKAIAPDTLIKETPVALVQRQLNAYNLRNIDAFVEPYADDIAFYYYPDKLLGKGKDNLRKQYAAIFQKVPGLHCEVTQRIIYGNIIVDHESVSGFGKNKVDGVVIYEVVNNKIKTVRIMQ